MKKIYLAAVVLLLPMLVAAQNIGMQELKPTIGKPEITKIGVLGKGIAISGSDLSDFEIIKIGVVDVKVQFNNQTITKQAGILWVGQDKYVLKNSVIGNGTLSSEIYINDTKIGNLDLVLVEKDETEVWTGEMTLNNGDYNVYILEGQRKFERNEIKQRLQEFCQGNNINCTQIAKGIGNRFCDKIDDPSCREKIAEFCEQNPTDQRCIAINRNFCQNNTDDARCRAILKERCIQNPENEECSNFCEAYPEKCRIMQQNAERIREKLERIQQLRQRVKGTINQTDGENR